MMHTSRGKVVCDPHRTPRNAEGLPLRPRFDEAEERDGSGVAHASSIESTETRVE